MAPQQRPAAAGSDSKTWGRVHREPLSGCDIDDLGPGLPEHWAFGDRPVDLGLGAGWRAVGLVVVFVVEAASVDAVDGPVAVVIDPIGTGRERG